MSVNQNTEDSSVDDYNTSANSATSPPSSFLQQLQGKLKRGGLQPTETKLTKPDGTVTRLRNQGTEILSGLSDAKSYGFVVDTKPNLTVSEIVPWLFVTSQDVPQELELLQKFNITHILSLLPGFELSPSVRNTIKSHLVLELYDEEFLTTDCDGQSTSMTVLNQAVDFIHEAKNTDESHKVLIHCNAGVSRAPTVALLYLMTKQHYTFDGAWKIVSSARQIAKPNNGFLNFLKNLQY